jgi:Isd11-like NADH dehydrogenase complex accessory subunit
MAAQYNIYFILLLIVALRCLLQSVTVAALLGHLCPVQRLRHLCSAVTSPILYAHNNFSSSRIHLQTSPQFEDCSRGSSPSYTVSSVACPPCRAYSSNCEFLRLYRSILRAHRHLPVEMRSLGDDYVKAGSHFPLSCSKLLLLTRPLASLEFRRHKDVTNPGYIIGFLSQWKVYLDQIPVGPEVQRFRGKKLDPTVFEKVRSKLYNTSGSADY